MIVGQGLAGTLLSFQLYKSGISHMVVSTHSHGTASLVAAGMFNPLVFKRITKSWMVDQLLPVMLKTFSELEKLLDCQLIFEKEIAKLISADEKEWWNQRIQSQSIHGYVKEFVPSEVISGVQSKFEAVILNQTGYVDLRALLIGYEQFLRNKNMLVESNFDYNDLDISNDRVVWQEHSAEKVIFCEGSAAINNPFFNEVKFYLTKGDVLEVEIDELSGKYILNKDVFLMPIGGNRFKLGSTYNHTDKSWEPDTKAAELLLQKASKIINKPIAIVKHHSGIRPTVSDRRPVLGIHPKFKQLGIFNGLGTKGVMLAPYFSYEMLQILETPSFEVNSEVSLKRFYK